MTGDRERTALYRIRGESDALLYIGITNSVPFRWNGHQAVQPWWDELRSLTVEWHETRDEAEAAEKAAILAEQPKYNVTYLKPTRGRRHQGKHPETELIDWESFTFEPRADDEDLLDIGDVTRMTRISSTSSARAALRRTGGPQGFTLGAQQHLVFRKGEIRRWIAAVEASQKPQAVPVPSAAARKTPRDKRRARMRALPGLEPLFDAEGEAS
jgi:predicted GIY-YIG superfamily endonuclease